MDNSQLAQFIEKIKADQDLRQRVDDAEKATAREIERHTDVITQIAADAGYDIAGWNGRPEGQPVVAELEATDLCTFTCCFTGTSA